MIFSNSQDFETICSGLDMKIDNVIIPVVKTARNLGIIFDKEMKFTDHVSLLIKKAYMNLRFFLLGALSYSAWEKINWVTCSVSL